MAGVAFDQISKIYDDGTKAVNHLSLGIGDGEFMVLVGPSGCGKTTALRMVAGLEDISEGVLTIGERIVNHVPSRDRDIAMVFQSYALYPHLSVYDNIAFGLKIKKVPKEEIEKRVGEAARILDLEPYLKRKPRALSGGQRQRVAMGRAIVREPSAFLMDEPLSNLDAKLRVQMRLEIQRLHARLATTSLYVTHDQIEAMTLAQRVIVMNRGHAEQIGPPTEIYERPATVFVASFIGSPAMNLLHGRLSSDGAAFDVAGGGPSLPVGGAPGVGREIAAGREWILGIRPEHMTPRRAAASTSAHAPLEVDSCELLGADNLAHGRWGAHDVAVRLAHADRPAPGDVLPAALPLEHLHFFDPATSRRVL